jgi:hypothetical protein
LEIDALDSRRNSRGGTTAMELGLAAVARMRKTAAAFQDKKQEVSGDEENLPRIKITERERGE